MLKDISGIRLCGANFDTMTEVLFLNPHEENSNKVKTVKGALLYGRNGAGKSTLAKAVKKCKGDNQDTISQAVFVDDNNNPLVLNEDEKAHVFVFDEEYIDKNIKFREAGLDTIIMLGQQAEIEEQLNEARVVLETTKADSEDQELIVHEYENADNDTSSKYYMRKIRWALQGDDSWSGRDKIIKGNRQNTGVRDDTYKQFISITTTKTRDQLLIEYNDKLKELRIAQQGEAIISTSVPTVSVDYDEKSITELLMMSIEKPELTERECYLLDLVQTGKSKQLGYMVDTFSDEAVGNCPICLQKVSREYKQDLVQSIKKILSKVVEEHQESLRTV